MNPFKTGSADYIDFNTMSDLKWHCTKCELVSGQAKTWQIWRQEKGVQLDVDEKGKWYNRIFCENCKRTTVHRKLKSTEILTDNLKARTSIPASIVKRTKALFENIDEYSVRKEPAAQLEIDHRIPQVRWTDNEDANDPNMSDVEIISKFMLLTRPNNLLKSRICEQCTKTGKRGKGYKTIEFWYAGEENYDNNIGCVGCFWHNPAKWREAINDRLK